jgi:hypothetical protein
MTEKICPKTLMVEITESDEIIASGAPCIKEQCMAWEPETEPEVISCGSMPKGYECRMTLAEKYPNIDDFDKNECWLWCDTCIVSKIIEGRNGYCKWIERG